MRKFLKNNGLSILFISLFLLSLVGQVVTGFSEHNEERKEEGQQALSFSGYFSSGHFIQATFENWESEFLQMALFIVLTISLYQRGSSESKDPDKDEEVDREPDPAKKDAPWPVKRGGVFLYLYKHSLTLVFSLLFFLSFILHLYGSFKDENEKLTIKHLPRETLSEYIVHPRFWFESFQNWQSEFLSVSCIVIFSIFLRQKGSPQSKPVDAPDAETGG